MLRRMDGWMGFVGLLKHGGMEPVNMWKATSSILEATFIFMFLVAFYVKNHNWNL